MLRELDADIWETIQTRALVLERIDGLERTEKVVHFKGRTDIAHEHVKELVSDPSHAEILEWIEQRWPRETLDSLLLIDGERVREIAWAFQKRMSCAEDQIVIEMLRALDSDIWETIASCFQFRLMNHWTEGTDALWRTQLVTTVKKNMGKLTMRGLLQIAILPPIHRLYSKDVAATGGTSSAVKTGSTVWSRPWSSSP